MGLCSCITDKEKENLYNDSFQKKNSGGDLFSIRTSVVYPADGRELIGYAAEEQDENARPELTSQIENWTSMIPFLSAILKWSRVISVYSGVLRGGRRANRYRKHNRKKKCV